MEIKKGSIGKKEGIVRFKSSMNFICSPEDYEFIMDMAKSMDVKKSDVLRALVSNFKKSIESELIKDQEELSFN